MSTEVTITTVRSKNNACTDDPPPCQPPPPDTTRVNSAVQEGGAEPDKRKWREEMRGWIMIVAVQVASVTYTSGLSPPGGFWQDDNNHKAGSAILHDRFSHRYAIFFYANATTFMTSLVIIILLMNKEFHTHWRKIKLLDAIMVLDLVSLMIAYAAGCARNISTSIYVLVLAAAVLLFVVYSARLLLPDRSSVSKA